MAPKQLIDDLCTFANWHPYGTDPAPDVASLVPAVARMKPECVAVAAETLIRWLGSRGHLGRPYPLRLDQPSQPHVRQLLLLCPSLTSLFEVRDDRVDLTPSMPAAEQRELERYAPLNHRTAVDLSVSQRGAERR